MPIAGETRQRQTGQWHTEYHAEQDVARIDMRVDRLEQPIEQLTITFVPHLEGGGALRLEWDTLRAAAAFTVVRLNAFFRFV